MSHTQYLLVSSDDTGLFSDRMTAASLNGFLMSGAPWTSTVSLQGMPVVCHHQLMLRHVPEFDAEKNPGITKCDQCGEFWANRMPKEYSQCPTCRRPS